MYAEILHTGWLKIVIMFLGTSNQSASSQCSIVMLRYNFISMQHKNITICLLPTSIGSCSCWLVSFELRLFDQTLRAVFERFRRSPRQIQQVKLKVEQTLQVRKDLLRRLRVRLQEGVMGRASAALASKEF